MKSKTTALLLKVGIFSLLIILAIFTAYTAYAKSYDFFLSFNMAQIPGIAIQNTPVPQVNAEGTPESIALPTTSVEPTPIPWDGARRVTVLVMGLDYRDWLANDGPPRTDTMILLTIDPLTKTAGILNIPRDLWANIPGFEPSKINTAYPIGVAYNVPGGGPGLAKLTVETLLGVPIDYYAIIDFYAFENFIDELGGINMTVYDTISIDPLGKANTVHLEPGNYLFDGPTALAYARARHTANDDFDRATRQQQVILAIRDKVIELGPAKVAARAPALYNELASGIHTDLSLDDALKLGWLALDINVEKDVKRGSIAPPKCVIFAKSPDGSQDILIPVTDQIRVVRDEVFSATNLASPILTSGDERANMEAEAASIVVANGSSHDGLAATTQNYLQSQGAKVVSTQNSDYTVYSRIIDYTGKPYTDRYLANLMQLDSYSILYQYDPNSQIDVLVILGDDWANNNPMP